ncbi:hypothetical protein SD427_09070 [Chryseobacterium sp. JJR-5R]|uniref:hypothetical protein n=1 Tax=Chryseobacterium sp. JJR-5R TaxID=3093923 RepID=UPI002A754C5C|nr:hypothetical protein [Chryseobacterium sp. JJR-5R]WPO84470.1 hypothetical protein SD427_09070 [Chryseobacterium sp. JJR-5R]
MKNISCIGVFGLMFAVPIGIGAQNNMPMTVLHNRQAAVNEQQRLNRFIESSYRNYSSDSEMRLKMSYNQLSRIEERIKKINAEIAEEKAGYGQTTDHEEKIIRRKARLDNLYKDKSKVQNRIDRLESSGRKTEKIKTDTLK